MAQVFRVWLPVAELCSASEGLLTLLSCDCLILFCLDPSKPVQGMASHPVELLAGSIQGRFLEIGSYFF